MERDYAGIGKRLTPGRIALVYVLVGGAWILLSDRAVATLPVDRALVTQLQTVKGWVFVGLSGLLVYGLVSHSRRQLRDANDKLTRALQQASVLHRILRHNLRNACNVIELEAERLAADGGETDESRHARTIERQVETLLELGEKSRHLRKIALGEQERLAFDLVPVVEAEVAEFRARHPEVSVTVDVPARARVRALPEIEVVIRELLANAVEFGTDGRAESPTVDVEVGRTDDAVTLLVDDDGPGLPEMEREVLERGVEEPLRHSQGLGLWVVRVIVADSGGDLEVRDAEPRGTVVRVEFQAAD